MGEGYKDLLLSHIFSDEVVFTDLDRNARIFIDFLKASSDISKEMHSRLLKHKLSVGKMFVLIIIKQSENNSLTPSEIADYLEVTRGTVTGLIEGLEKDGFVRRSMSNLDRRMISVTLTEEGNLIIAKVMPYFVNLILEVSSIFSIKDFEYLETASANLREGLKKIKGE